MKLTEARKVLNTYREVYDGSGVTLSPEKSAEMREALDAVLGTPDEPTFIIKTRDRFGPNTVRNWIWNLRTVAGEEARVKLGQACEVLDRMQLFHETRHEEVRNPE